MNDEIILFAGEIGAQRVRVWLEPADGGFMLNSHDIGPGLERFFGDTEIREVRIAGVHAGAYCRRSPRFRPVAQSKLRELRAAGLASRCRVLPGTK
jgi:hypothetical protein